MSNDAPTPLHKSPFYVGNYFATMAATRDRLEFSYWPRVAEDGYQAMKEAIYASIPPSGRRGLGGHVL